MARRKHPAEKYAEGVLSGKVKAARWVRLAVERHAADLKDGHKRGLVWNPAAGQRAIDFTERFLHHSKGEWAGMPLALEPWQQWRKLVLFGWYTEDGLRRFRHHRRAGLWGRFAGADLPQNPEPVVWQPRAPGDRPPHYAPHQ